MSADVKPRRVPPRVARLGWFDVGYGLFILFASWLLAVARGDRIALLLVGEHLYLWGSLRFFMQVSLNLYWSWMDHQLSVTPPACVKNEQTKG